MFSLLSNGIISCFSRDVNRGTKNVIRDCNIKQPVKAYMQAQKCKFEEKYLRRKVDDDTKRLKSRVPANIFHSLEMLSKIKPSFHLVMNVVNILNDQCDKQTVRY